tara:strand:- start:368 stop:580 length:213 start_codon:yes stop_codon:yes gene_type:complete
MFCPWAVRETFVRALSAMVYESLNAINIRKFFAFGSLLFDLVCGFHAFCHIQKLSIKKRQKTGVLDLLFQ